MVSLEIQTDPLKDIDIEEDVCKKIDPILAVVEGPVVLISAIIFDLSPFIGKLISQKIRSTLPH